jgi:uncharacterized protein
MEDEMASVAVVGASNNRDKYGNKAVRAYIRQGYTVYPVNLHEETIEGLTVYPSLGDLPSKPDRVAFYIPPDAGLDMLPEVVRLEPDEFFINPGAESDELIEKAYEMGLTPILACAIVDIGESPSVY